MNEPFSLHPFADSVAGAASLAKALGMPTSPIRVHRFPDDESLVTAPKYLRPNAASPATYWWQFL